MHLFWSRKKPLHFGGNPNPDPEMGISNGSFTTLGRHGNTPDWWVMFNEINLHVRLPGNFLLHVASSMINTRAPWRRFRSPSTYNNIYCNCHIGLMHSTVTSTCQNVRLKMKIQHQNYRVCLNTADHRRSSQINRGLRCSGMDGALDHKAATSVMPETPRLAYNTLQLLALLLKNPHVV